MADVLIKGMEMPKSCEKCPMRHGESIEQYCYYGYNMIYINPLEDYHKRNSKCPLVEVPEPHGDLVDRNVLLLEIENYPRNSGIIKEEIEAEIKELPTILESSNG